MIVTTLATLQPLNAYFRPHGPKPGEVITSTRQNWQYLHKGSGYIAAILGFVNVIIGVEFGWNKFQNGAFTGLTGALLGIGFLVLTGYWISKCMSKKVSDKEKGDQKSSQYNFYDIYIIYFNMNICNTYTYDVRRRIFISLLR